MLLLLWWWKSFVSRLVRASYLIIAPDSRQSNKWHTAQRNHHTSTGTTSQDVEEFSENIKRTEAVINEDFRDLKLPLLKQLCA